MECTQTNQDTDDQLKDVNEVRMELARLRSEIARLEAALDQHAPSDGGTATDEVGEPDRRAILRHVGAAAAGVVAAGGVLWSEPRPALAANNDPVLLGRNGAASNAATATTEIRGAPSSSTLGVFVVQDTPFSASTYPAMIGGFTDGDNGILNGVHGYSGHVDGNGVVGFSERAGVYARGNVTDLLLHGSRPNPDGEAGVPGALTMASTDELWTAVGSSTDDWRRLAGPGTTGALTVLPVPKRIYDSRNAGGKFVNESRVMDAKANLSGVPVRCQAVLVNFAVTSTSSGGYGSLWAAGAPDPGTASVNWGGVSNMTLNNTVVTAVDSASMFNCKIASSAHVIIDIVGYYR